MLGLVGLDRDHGILNTERGVVGSSRGFAACTEYDPWHENRCDTDLIRVCLKYSYAV